MAKRANGEGSVRKRPGRDDYQGRISYRDPATGNMRTLSVNAKTDKACRAELRKAIRRIEAGLPARDASMTVGEWVAQWRETSLRASSRKATTKSLYSTLAHKHLEQGAIAKHGLDKLRPSHVEALLLDLDDLGYAESTIRQIYTVLRGALDIAVRDSLLGENPTHKVKRPTVTHKEAHYLSAADTLTLLNASKGLRYHLAMVLMALTGMRRGEVAGLHWSDIDLVKGELSVRNTVARVDGALIVSTPKTAKSLRKIPLPASLVTQLKAHKVGQTTERLAAGDQWTVTNAVFASEFGTYVDPRNMLRTVEIAAKKADLGKVGAHTLRHSAAVAWLEAGGHIKAVADLLGHSSISITGDLYGHTSTEYAREIVAGLGEAMGM